MKVDKDMVTSFLQIQPDNLIKTAALQGGAVEDSADKKWNKKVKANETQMYWNIVKNIIKPDTKWLIPIFEILICLYIYTLSIFYIYI